MTERSFLFLVASGRIDGNSERLAKRAAAALPESVLHTWVRLEEEFLSPFRDLRHAAGGFPAPAGAELALLETTLAATDIVFVTPVYWYSLPASAKRYLDTWTAWLPAPGMEFATRMRGKRMWAVVTDASEPGDNAAAPLIDSLSRSAKYMEMEWRGALLGHGNRPGEALSDPATQAAADRFFQ